jgi:hypothetical protein
MTSLKKMRPLFRIVLCELFHSLIFGKDENSDKNIDGHFLVINSYNRSIYSYMEEEDEEDEEEEEEEEEDDEEEEDEEEYEEYEECIPLYNSNIFEIVEKEISSLNLSGGRRTLPNINHPLINHPLIRNYREIVKKCLRFEIAECITLSGGEYVAIIKTFWIKIIIRTFKNAFKRKMWNKYSQRLKGMKETNTPILKGLLNKLS